MSTKTAAYVSFFIPVGILRQHSRPLRRLPKEILSWNTISFHPASHSVRCELQDSSEEDSEFSKLKADIQEYLQTFPQSDSNPLTYINLRKAGRTDLISRIMDNGGYIQVSRRLGIPVQESDFIPPPPVVKPAQLTLKNSLEEGAALAIGKDLEARLDSVEDVIKNMTQTGNNSLRLSAKSTSRPADNVPSAEQLLMDNEKFVPPIIDQPVAVGERFVLPASMRVGMLSWLIIISVGFGRTSQHLIPEGIVAACQSVAGALIVGHFVVGTYAGFVLAPQLKRNPVLWFFKVLLAGPIGVQYLRLLGSL